MEESEGAKVEKEEKDDLMEEGEGNTERRKVLVGGWLAGFG